MKVTILPKEAEQIREAFTVQKQVLEEKLEAMRTLNRERQNLKGELTRIKMESFENPYVIVRDHYEEKKAKYLSESDNDGDILSLRRKINVVECLVAKYDYLLNGPEHKGRFPNRTKPLLFT